MDEITYLISKFKKLEELEELRIQKKIIGLEEVPLLKREAIPLCSPPPGYLLSNFHPEVKILGFREERGENFVEIGYGKLNPIEKEESESKPKEKKEYYYMLETNADVKEGDFAIQNYGPCWKVGEKCGVDSVLCCKALDDRVGSVAVIYAIKELAKCKIPAKAILTGGEEGVPTDISWDRLIRPTFRKYCRRDGIFIICDGVDGKKLLDEPVEREGKYVEREGYVSEALVLPYTAYGKGPGDPAIFSLLTNRIAPLVRSKGFSVDTTTSYVSRSTGIKIMDDFPLMGYIDWSNGEVGDPSAVCHLEEKVLMQQVINVIGMLAYAVAYFNKRIPHKIPRD